MKIRRVSIVVCIGADIVSRASENEGEGERGEDKE